MARVLAVPVVTVIAYAASEVLKIVVREDRPRGLDPGCWSVRVNRA
ncbi:hypothetical protein EV193_103618 [Herbihabitans rhizosphaerae]|uniref:Uncharacterized protein n=1 Tax=Herbihabitans rhizosphaerae TaxID=1872711 RepID=A0A4Q7KXC2_9PSEU|nr:hypothetical protein EV193_103618 [Herbihabitans rhizosphaerae]